MFPQSNVKVKKGVGRALDGWRQVAFPAPRFKDGGAGGGAGVGGPEGGRGHPQGQDYEPHVNSHTPSRTRMHSHSHTHSRTHTPSHSHARLVPAFYSFPVFTRKTEYSAINRFFRKHTYLRLKHLGVAFFLFIVSWKVACLYVRKA